MDPRQATRASATKLKRDLYERTGVREYWLVYPQRQAIRVARRDNQGGFATMPELSAAEHETLTSPLLPGLSMDVAALFKRRARK